MYDAKTASDYVKGAFPYKFDRIEVTGGVFSGPPPGYYLMADFQRPREPVTM